MPLNKFQQANFRNHSHYDDQLIDSDTGDPIETGGLAVRIIYGRVARDGSILSGTGDFDVSHTGAGEYTITWDTPFTAPPSVIVTLGEFASGSREGVASRVVGGGATALSLTNVQILGGDPGDVLADVVFDFIAVGV